MSDPLDVGLSGLDDVVAAIEQARALRVVAADSRVGRVGILLATGHPLAGRLTVLHGARVDSVDKLPGDATAVVYFPLIPPDEEPPHATR